MYLNGHLQNPPGAFTPFFSRQKFLLACRGGLERTGREKPFPATPHPFPIQCKKETSPFFFLPATVWELFAGRERSRFDSQPSTTVLLFMQRSASKISRGLARAAGGNLCEAAEREGKASRTGQRGRTRRHTLTAPSLPLLSHEGREGFLAAAQRGVRGLHLPSVTRVLRLGREGGRVYLLIAKRD